MACGRISRRFGNDEFQWPVRNGSLCRPAYLRLVGAVEICLGRNAKFRERLVVQHVDAAIDRAAVDHAVTRAHERKGNC